MPRPAKSIEQLTNRFPPQITDPMAISPEDTDLSGYIFWLFERSGMTRKELAEFLGKTSGYVSGMLTGHIQQPSPDVLHRLAELYHVPVVKFYQMAGYFDDHDVAQLQVRPPKYLGVVEVRELSEMLAQIEDESLLRYCALMAKTVVAGMVNSHTRGFEEGQDAAVSRKSETLAEITRFRHPSMRGMAEAR